MEKDLVKCPIDNKNLLEDPFEDEVFADFNAAYDHHEDGIRHLIGQVNIYDEEFPKCVNYSANVDVYWNFGHNTVTIKVIGVSPSEDFKETRDEVFNHYKKIFSAWECDDNPGLVVKFSSCPSHDSLYVSFYWSED